MPRPGSDRVAKYNQLLRIEEGLGEAAAYHGGRAFARWGGALVTVTTPARRFTPDQVRRRRRASPCARVSRCSSSSACSSSWCSRSGRGSDQRAALDRSRHQLEVLQREQARLANEAKRLADPQEIERLARARYGMVRHGEQAYSVVPAPPTSTTLPGAP